jgi:hypothetical protein
VTGKLPPLALSGTALVLANLVPLGGTLLGLWSAYDLLLLFWAENVVVGLFQVLRMGSVLVLRRDFVMIVVMPFFVFHYGMFTLIHGVFVTSALAPAGEAGYGRGLALLLSPQGLLWALLALTASHAFSFALNFLGQGEWRHIGAETLMKQPYVRVVVLHLVIILGGVTAMALGGPMAALVLLVLIKTAVDLAAHRREHLAAQRG